HSLFAYSLLPRGLHSFPTRRSSDLTESLLVASIGAVFGIAFALWATDYLDQAVHNSANPIPSWMNFTVDLKVLLAVVTATMLSADRKSTRLNSSHVKISYAVFCLKK